MLNSEAKEELDGFGDHLEVLVEFPDGNMFEVDEITTRNLPEGVVIVVTMGLHYGDGN